MTWGWDGIREPTNVFYAQFKKEALNRVSQRLVGDPCPWVKIWWKTGMVHMFCARPLRGFKEPRRWKKLSPAEAIDLLTVTLALPYVEQVRGKHGWGQAGKQSSGQFAGFTEDPDVFLAAVDATVAELTERTGIEFHVVVGRRLPPEVDVDMFIDLVRGNLRQEPV